MAFYEEKFIPINEKVIPIQERGHQFGDGVYEVIRVYRQIPFLLNEHLDRLERSAHAILLKLPFTRDRMNVIIHEGICRSGIDEAEVYLQVTRGIAPRIHSFPKATPQFSMTVREARKFDPIKRNHGINVWLTDDERWANCYIKSLNLLPNVLAKQIAVSNGADEAILTKEGNITEGSSSNVFVIKDQIVYTPPATKNILHGITRATVLKICQNLNVICKEKNFDVPFLLDADEVFITSTSYEIMPIAFINNHELPKSKTLTKQLQKEYTILT